MLRELIGRRAWPTQRIANALPLRSRARGLIQSVSQQLSQPLGRELEDTYWWENYNLGEYLLDSSDKDSIENLNKLVLPPTFSFNTRRDSDGVVYIKPSLVRGKLADSSWVTLEQATDNRLEEFWYGAPSRITVCDDEDSRTYYSVLPPTLVGDLPSALPVSPAIPGKLWVTLSNIGESVKLYSGTEQRASVELTGYDIHDLEVTERLAFAFDGTVQTKTAWAEITSVLTEYVDTTAYLQIEWLSINPVDSIDLMGINISKYDEKIRFFSMGTESFGSTLCHKVFCAPDLATVEEGDMDKESVFEMELLDVDGLNISASGMCLWPKRRWVLITDGDYVHFHLADIALPDVSPLTDRTQEVVLQMYAEKEFYLRGDTISLNYNLRRPFFRVMKVRWSILKPDGTRVGLSETGAEITYSSTGWLENINGARFKKLGFDKTPIDYTFTTSGRYVFYLESMIADDLTTTPRYVEQTDVLVISVATNTAISSAPLPLELGLVTNVHFDAYGRPWAMSSDGVATLLTFHYDTYIADFINKIIYTRDDYEQIEVTI